MSDRPAVRNLLLAINLLGTAAPVCAQKTSVTVPILAVMLADRGDAYGILQQVRVTLRPRTTADPVDKAGLSLVFDRSGRARFMQDAEDSIRGALHDVMPIARWNPPETVVMELLGDISIQGDSISATIALHTLALSRGLPVRDDVVMTGASSVPGFVLSVCGLSQKIDAGERHHYRKIIIPEHWGNCNGSWSTPFLSEIIPVRTLDRAFEIMTGQRLAP